MNIVTNNQKKQLNKRRKIDEITVKEYQRSKYTVRTYQQLIWMKFLDIEIMLKHANRTKITATEKQMAKKAVILIKETFKV